MSESLAGMPPVLRNGAPAPAAKPAPAARARRLVRLRQGTFSRLADGLFRYAMLACALSLAGLLGLIVYELIANSRLSIQEFGWGFFTRLPLRAQARSEPVRRNSWAIFSRPRCGLRPRRSRRQRG